MGQGVGKQMDQCEGVEVRMQRRLTKQGGCGIRKERQQWVSCSDTKDGSEWVGSVRVGGVESLALKDNFVHSLF